MIPERRRLPYALLLSLLIHTWLLTLTFSGQGFGLPSFSLPWQDRRIEAPDLRVALVSPPVTTSAPAVTPAVSSSQPAGVEQPVARSPAATPSVSLAPKGEFAGTIVQKANPRTEVKPNAGATPSTEAATKAVSARAPSAVDRAAGAEPAPGTAPAMIAVDRSDEETWLVPPPIVTGAPDVSSQSTAMSSLPELPEPVAPVVPAPIVATAPNAPNQSTALSPLPELPEPVAPVVPAPIGTTVPDASSQSTAMSPLPELPEPVAPVVPPPIVATAPAASSQLVAMSSLPDLAKLASAQQIQRAEQPGAAQQEAARAEAARQEAARAEAQAAAAKREERLRAIGRQLDEEAARSEAARQQAAQAVPAQRQAVPTEAARSEAQTAEEKREARLRAIGRQLDEEAARRDAEITAAPQAPLLPPSMSPVRRYRLLGRTDPNQEIIRYAEAWERKIELNMTFDKIREVARRPHTDPLVTVAIRSDGSVESVTIVQSSGVAALDAAIRSIVDAQKPYQAFPQSLARQYDVIEIRRTWYFDTAIRLY